MVKYYGFDNVENVPNNSNENKEKKSTIAQLEIGFHKPPILNATFVFGLGHQETD